MNWLDLRAGRRGAVLRVLRLPAGLRRRRAGVRRFPRRWRARADWSPARCVGSIEPGPGAVGARGRPGAGAATVGQVTSAGSARWSRNRITWRPARVVDARARRGRQRRGDAGRSRGSWRRRCAPAPLPTLSRQISDSQVVTARRPGDAASRPRTLFSSFREVLDDNGLPTVFGGLSPERIRPVPPPDGAVAGTAAVRRAAESVVKVSGTADDCSRTLEGSGFVYAPRHVHDQRPRGRRRRRPAGAGDRRRASCSTRGSWSSTPTRDLAVLYVPELSRGARSTWTTRPAAATRPWSPASPAAGRSGSVAARIRDDDQRPRPGHLPPQAGHPGGVLAVRRRRARQLRRTAAVSPDGDVYGVIFAKSLDDPNTGYALTADEAPQRRAGRPRRHPRVDTEPCA